MRFWCGNIERIEKAHCYFEWGKRKQQRRRKAALQSLQDEEKRKEIELVKEAEMQKKRYEEEVATNERRKRDAQERALRLQEEADAMKRRREEREKREQEKRASRQALRSRLEALQQHSGATILEGIVNVQFEGQLRWRRKAFELKQDAMVLKPADGLSAALSYQPIETIEVTRDSIASLTDTFEEIQTPHSVRATFRAGIKVLGNSAITGEESTSLLFSTNSEEEKEKLLVGLSVLSDYHDETV